MFLQSKTRMALSTQDVGALHFKEWQNVIFHSFLNIFSSVSNIFLNFVVSVMPVILN